MDSRHILEAIRDIIHKEEHRFTAHAHGRKLQFATDGNTLVSIALKAPELEARGQPAYSNSCWG